MAILCDNLSIDWLEVTQLKPTYPKILIDKLGLNVEDLKKLETGLNGYKDRFICQNSGAVFLENGTAEMGEHLTLSGSACRYYYNFIEDLTGMAYLLAHDPLINITRLDLALDVFDKKLFSKCLEEYKKDNFLCKFKTTKHLETKKAGVTTGGTLYFGSRSSQVMIRIYDKGAEQKKEIDWTRIEIVIKKDYAKKALEESYSKGGIKYLYFGLINNYLRFVDYKETNISRSPTASWWLDIVGTIEKLKLYTPPLEKNIETIKSWLEEQVSASLYTIAEAEQSTNYIWELMRLGGEKAKDKHYNLIEDFRRKEKK